MKKNIKQILAVNLFGLLLITSMTKVNAEEITSSNESVEYQSNEEESFSNATQVFAEIASSYEVTIPKTIVLSGATKQGHYNVKVSGDISAHETIYVIPESTVDLYSNNKNMVAGTITQDKDSWTYSTLSDIANGTVEASGIDAGKWSGIFYFNINITNVMGDVIDPDHVHTPDTAVKENVIKSTFTELGSYDEVLYCKDCKEEISRVSKPIDKLQPVVIGSGGRSEYTPTKNGSYDTGVIKTTISVPDNYLLYSAQYHINSSGPAYGKLYAYREDGTLYKTLYSGSVTGGWSTQHKLGDIYFTDTDRQNIKYFVWEYRVQEKAKAHKIKKDGIV